LQHQGHGAQPTKLRCHPYRARNYEHPSCNLSVPENATDADHAPVAEISGVLLRLEYLM
ncbi:hypothetical protein NDU88_000299, partial [Pleurodeles waltl]